MRASRGIIPAFLMAVVILTFGSLIFCDFIIYDDAIFVYHNPKIISTSWQNIWNIFSTSHAFGYTPLPLLTHVFEYSLLGVNPSIYHLGNILLHGLTAILVFFLVRLLLGNFKCDAADTGAWAAATLFAVHPLHTEVVAWVSCRKALLCVFFFLLSMICFAKFKPGDKGGGRKLYFLSLIFYVLSLLSMIYSICLPFSFLTAEKQALWPKKNIKYHLPFWILSVFIFIVWVKCNPVIGHGGWAMHLEFSRVKGVAFAFIFYLVKLFAPFPLSILYPRPDLDASFFPHLYFMAIPAAALISILAFSFRKKFPFLFFGIIFYALALLPVLPVLDHTHTLVHDHYAYLSSIGILFILGWLIAKFSEINRPVMTVLVFTVSILSICFSGMATHQCEQWRNTKTIIGPTLSRYPGLAPAHMIRGEYYRGIGEYQKALADFNEAIHLRPEVYTAYEFRARVYRQLENTEAAAQDENTVRHMLSNPKSKVVY